MDRILLTRFNTRYAQKIDRMVIVADDLEGTGMILRLHPDLMQQMVGKLCTWIEQTAAPATMVKTKVVTTQQREAYNDMAQSQARVEKVQQPMEPVRPKLFTRHSEPNSLSMTLKGKTLVVDFKDDAQELATRIEIHKQGVRQWLDILHRHWQRSQWNQEVWPAWIAQAEKSVAH